LTFVATKKTEIVMFLVTFRALLCQFRAMNTPRSPRCRVVFPLLADAGGPLRECGGTAAAFSGSLRALAQYVLLDLSGGRLGERPEHHVLRNLIAGEIVTTPADDVGRVDR